MDKSDQQRQAPRDETRDEILLRLLKTPPSPRPKRERAQAPAPKKKPTHQE